MIKPMVKDNFFKRCDSLSSTDLGAPPGGLQRNCKILPNIQQRLSFKT